MKRPRLTPETLRRIMDDLQLRLSVARRHTPFGILLPADLAGIYRRTAQVTGTKPETVAQLHKLASAT